MVRILTAVCLTLAIGLGVVGCGEAPKATPAKKDGGAAKPGDKAPEAPKMDKAADKGAEKAK